MADIKYNVLAAKKLGATDEQLAKIIAEDQGKDYDALIKQGLTPEKIIFEGNKAEFSLGDIVSESFSQGATSSIRGVQQLTGTEFTDDQLRDETRFRQMAEQNPWAAYSASIVGNILGDPTNLIPGALLFKGAKTVGSVAGRLGLLGAASGALEPVYDPEEDSRLANVGVGAAFGGLIGGASAKLLGVGKMLPDEISDLADNTKKQGMDIDGNPLYNVGDAENSTFNPADVPSYVQNPIEGVPNAIQLPILPPELVSGKRPNAIYGSTIKFETDLDKGLYNLTTNSKDKDAYMQYLTEALGVSEKKANELATGVRKELLDKTKQLQKQAALTGIKVEDIPFQMSKTLDNFLNPVDKHLDDFSKMVYNTGAKIPLDANSKIKLSNEMVKDPSFQKITDAFKAEGLASTPDDIAANIKGYNKMLDELKDINGRAFKPRSFEDYVKNNLSFDEHLDLIKNGAFDGCPL